MAGSLDIRALPTSFESAVSISPSHVNFEEARKEHAQYIELLSHLVDHVLLVPADEKYPDCVFVEDTVVIFSGVCILTNVGHPSRKGELDVVCKILSERVETGAYKYGFEKVIDMRELAEDESDAGTFGAELDGGDVLITGRHCFVGHSARTNAAGIEVLRRHLHLPVIAVDVIGDLHLKSLVTHASARHLIIKPSEGGDHFSKYITTHFGPDCGGYVLYKASTIAACNVLLVNKTLLVPTGTATLPEIVALAADAGDLVIMELPNFEMAKKDGCLTCRSVIF